MKRKNKVKIAMGLSIIAGATLAYFVWLTWAKLTDFIGNSNLVWGITGALVLIFLALGCFSINRIVERFT